MEQSLIHKLEEVRRIRDLSDPKAEWFPGPMTLRVQGSTTNIQQYAAELHRSGVFFETSTPQEINIPFAELAPNTDVYYEEKNFIKNFHDKQPPTKDIAIVDIAGGWAIYDALTKTVHRSASATPMPYLISNAVAYSSLLPVLKSSAFADYENETDKEIVLYSAQKGIKKISVPADMPVFDALKDLGPGMIALRERLEERSAKDFVKCFKDILAGFTGSTKEQELKEVIVSLPGLITSADNNLQVYYKGFSFDKLRNDLLKEKDKYFAALRDILGKIMNQIVGLPVSLAASVYTSYKANDNIVLILVLSAYIAYAWFTHYLQGRVLNDLSDVEVDFKADFDNIASSSGLPADTISREQKKIERRIHDIRQVIHNYRWLLWGSAVIFCFFIIYQVVHNITTSIPSVVIIGVRNIFFLLFFH